MLGEGISVALILMGGSAALYLLALIVAVVVRPFLVVSADGTRIHSYLAKAVKVSVDGEPALSVNLPLDLDRVAFEVDEHTAVISSDGRSSVRLSFPAAMLTRRSERRLRRLLSRDGSASDEWSGR